MTLARRSGSGGAARRREALAAYLFILPNTAGFVIFFLVPMVAALILGFTNWDLIQPPQWVGLANYAALLRDPDFWAALWHTVYFTVVSVPAAVALSLLLAIALNTRLRERMLYRLAFFSPWVTMPVAIALVWKFIYDPNFGLIDSLLADHNLPTPPWLSDPAWAMPSLIIVAVWKSLGYNMIIFLAGLQGIPRELYEAASIDGAGPWARFWHVTLPLISPSTFFVLVISLINSFQVFDLPWIMTQGGPGNATAVLAISIYNNGFQYFKMGYATAIAWALFALVLVVTAAQVIGQKRWVHYEG